MRTIEQTSFFLNSLSRRRPLSYRNQSIDLQSKSMDWFLYDNGLRHERVNLVRFTLDNVYARTTLHEIKENFLPQIS